MADISALKELVDTIGRARLAWQRLYKSMTKEEKEEAERQLKEIRSDRSLMGNITEAHRQVEIIEASIKRKLTYFQWISPPPPWA